MAKYYSKTETKKKKEAGKISLLFDATVIANGINNDSNRSGIYFTAWNILKSLSIRPDINLALYCSKESYNDLCTLLKKEYLDKRIIIISDIKDLIYIKLKRCRNNFKQKNNVVAKFILQVLCLLYSPIAHIHEKILKQFFYKRIKQSTAYFSPIFSIPEEIKKIPRIKKYTLLHDIIPLLFPEKHRDSNETSSFTILYKSLNSSDYYFTNSENTRQDFLKHCKKIDSNKITTSLLACSENFVPCSNCDISVIKEKYNIPQDKKYIFSLCTLEPRKNLIRAVKTFIQFIKDNNIDDLVFVLGGGHWEEFISIIEQEIENLGNYKNKVIKAGYIDDEDLPALYSGAEWFVYTSMYEGFGLPPLEAMSCGCPVITSNNSSLPEVVGDAGIMIDWDSDEQHIKAYEKYYYDKDLRKQFAKKGLERAKQFSWDKCVGTIIERMHND